MVPLPAMYVDEHGPPPQQLPPPPLSQHHPQQLSHHPPMYPSSSQPPPPMHYNNNHHPPPQLHPHQQQPPYPHHIQHHSQLGPPPHHHVQQLPPPPPPMSTPQPQMQYVPAPTPVQGGPHAPPPRGMRPMANTHQLPPSSAGPSAYPPPQRLSSEPESVGMNGTIGRKEKRKKPNSGNDASALEREREKNRRLQRYYLDQRDAYTGIAQSLHTNPQGNREYVMRLYPISLERSAWLNQIEMEESWALESARHTWEEERAKIEDEHKKGKERVRERLLEGIEERRKKAREEKESESFLADAPAFEPPPTPRPAKKPSKPAPFVLAAPHPFGAAGEEMVSPFPLPLTAFAGAGGWANGKRRQKGVGQTGGLTLGKAITNIGGLKESEIEYDMGEIKKGVKRKRARAH